MVYLPGDVGGKGSVISDYCICGKWVRNGQRVGPWLFQNFCGEYVEKAGGGPLHDMVRMSDG